MFDWLHARGGDADAKNDVLQRLLRAAGGNDEVGDLAVALLLLALWPGLCVNRYRLRPLCRTDTLDADLLGGLTAGIRSAQPQRTRRVAATLLRNLERDLRRAYIREDRWSRLTINLDLVGHKVAQTESDRPEEILSSARAALGEDGALLAAVHIAGFTQREAAAAFGLSHDAARKRCQRALARLKQNYDA
ncbi:sigma-70 family RNA polymerase sigma factor [Loktanella fryxellensis]|nr:sigma-70 family RNA polymerase sigma factor [Loktanella fryxellensis]